MAQDKIMIVDNETDIIQLIRLHLTRQGYDVVYTADSLEALSLFEKEDPQLLLLDIMMPGLNGYELCTKIRERSSVPILFMSCKGQDIDKVMGFTIGGDDYITKPFSVTELTARVSAHLRRYHLGQGDSSAQVSISNHSSIDCGDIKIDTISHCAFLGSVELALTTKEYDLLCLLCKSPNRVFTPHQIFDMLWDPYGTENDVRTIAVHISNLRKKLEAAGASHKYIRTVRGVGYKLVLPS